MLSEASRTNLNEFVPVTEVTTEHDLLVRLDKNSPLSSPFLEWEDAERQTGADLPTVAESNFDISPTLRLFTTGQATEARLPPPRNDANGLAREELLILYADRGEVMGGGSKGGRFESG